MDLFFWRKATYQEVPEDWQGRCMNAERLLKAERESHAQAQQELEGVQENLKNCVIYLEETAQPLIEDQAKLAERITALLEQCHMFQARIAYLEDEVARLKDEVARLKHKKLPIR